MRLTRRSHVLSLSIICTLALILCVVLMVLRDARAQTLNTRAASQSAPALVAAPSQTSPSQTSKKPDAGLRLLNVSVIDSFGRNVTGLGREAFSIYEDESARDVVFFDDTDAPRGVGIVFDLSRSVGAVALDPARGAVVRLARSARERDEIFVVGFDGRAQLFADWTHDETALIKGLNALGHVEQRGGTALYDALALAVERAAAARALRPAVVVVSDGHDTNSTTKLSSLREMLRRSGVVLYVVRVDGGRDVSGLGLGTEIQNLARMTGGLVVFANSGVAVSEAFERIWLDLHTAYTLGFRPAAADGKWHKLKVKVQPPPKWPRLEAHAREGFYADDTDAPRNP